MINVFDNKKCCGCNACINICPVKCITNKTDEKGFAYPIVDSSKCIGCNLCEKTCPMLNTATIATPLSTEGMINNNETERLESSSGGIFTVLAKEIISRGGVVFGAAFTEDFRVIHVSAETEDQLAQFRGSKYIQSDTNACYSEIKNLLSKQRWVLFSGTPCQVRGLHLYLKKPYDRLVTIDFVCHGVPNYEVFKAYLEDEERKNPMIFSKGMATINFRDKSHAGWHGYCLALKTRDNSRESVELRNSAYMRGFGANLFLRPSCHECPSKNFSSGADITLADYWRVELINAELDDNKGTSLVSILSNKGENLMSCCKGITREVVNAEEAYRFQTALRNSMPVTAKNRMFWESDWRNNFIDEVNRICSHKSLKQHITTISKSALKKIGVKKALSIFSNRFK